MKPINITSPLDPEVIEKLKAGDQVLITGTIYTARDAAHQRLVAALDKGEKPPLDLDGQTIYYMGPTPARPWYVIGSAGPTTSGRMDIYTPKLLAYGVKGMIGKGARSQAVKEAIRKYKAIYFAAVGGAGALISKTIKKVETVAYEDLVPEAIRRLEVENFPAIVVNDIYGGDLYQEGKAKYQVATKPSPYSSPLKQERAKPYIKTEGRQPNILEEEMKNKMLFTSVILSLVILLSPIMGCAKVKEKAEAMKPEIRAITLKWGEVTPAITEVLATIQVYNPNPVSLPVKKVFCVITMNGIRMGSAETIDLKIEKNAEFPIKISAKIDNTKIPSFWAEHLKRNERSETLIDINTTFDLLVRDFAFPYRLKRPIETDLLSALKKVGPIPVKKKVKIPLVGEKTIFKITLESLSGK